MTNGHGTPVTNTARASNNVETLSKKNRLYESSSTADTREHKSVLKLLIESIKTGDVDSVRELLKDNPEAAIMCDDESLLYPIHYAAKHGRPEILELLIEADADLQVQTHDEEGLQPIHFAARFGQRRVVTYLVSKFPTILTVADKKGNVALHHAAKFPDIKFVEFIFGLSPNQITRKNSQGSLPIHYAAIGNQVDAVKYFLAIDPTLKSQENNNYNTPLRSSVSHGATEVIEYLAKENPEIFEAEIPAFLEIMFAKDGTLEVDQKTLDLMVFLSIGLGIEDMALFSAVLMNKQIFVDAFFEKIEGQKVRIINEPILNVAMIYSLEMARHLVLKYPYLVNFVDNISDKTLPVALQAALFADLDLFQLIWNQRYVDFAGPEATENRLKLVSYAVQGENLELLKWIEQHVDPKFGETKAKLISTAIASGQVTVLEYLIEQGYITLNDVLQHGWLHPQEFKNLDSLTWVISLSAGLSLPFTTKLWFVIDTAMRLAAPRDWNEMRPSLQWMSAVLEGKVEETNSKVSSMITEPNHADYLRFIKFLIAFKYDDQALAMYAQLNVHQRIQNIPSLLIIAAASGTKTVVNSLNNDFNFLVSDDVGFKESAWNTQLLWACIGQNVEVVKAIILKAIGENNFANIDLRAPSIVVKKVLEIENILPEHKYPYEDLDRILNQARHLQRKRMQRGAIADRICGPFSAEESDYLIRAEPYSALRYLPREISKLILDEAIVGETVVSEPEVGLNRSRTSVTTPINPNPRGITKFRTTNSYEHTKNSTLMIKIGSQSSRLVVDQTLVIDGGTLRLDVETDLFDEIRRTGAPTKFTIIEAKKIIGQFKNVMIFAGTHQNNGYLIYYNNYVEVRFN